MIKTLVPTRGRYKRFLDMRVRCMIKRLAKLVKRTDFA